MKMVRESTTTRRNDLLEMFLDATANEAYAKGRLKTRRNESGVELVAYHEHVIAQINERADEITLFTGHFGAHSQTVDRYISELGRLLNDRPNFEVTVLEGHAPSTGYGRVAEAGQYISNSLSPWGEQSPAERHYFERMQNALAERL